MKPDITTKILLAAVAVGLFLNVFVTLAPEALALDKGDRKWNPVYVHCVNC